MYVAIDVGGSKTLIVVFDSKGKELARDKKPTDRNYDKFIATTCKSVEDIVEEPHRIELIAVAVPGLVDYHSKKVLNFGNREWHDVDIRKALQEHFEVPVLIDNDANFGAIGESNTGAATGYDTCLYITISTGIGTGITYKGKIDRALAHSEGGQMHFRHEGALVRWEKFASGKAFYDRFGKMGKDVPIESDIWREWAEDVSLGIGGIIAVIQPDVIVIGGSMGEWLEKYRAPLLNALQIARAPVTRIPPIVEAKDPHNAVINGCLVAMEQHAKHH